MSFQQLITACSQNDKVKVQELQKHPDIPPHINDLIQIRDGDKRTALHIAYSSGSLDIVKLLLQCGAVDSCDSNGNSAMYWALWSKFDLFDKVKLLLAQDKRNLNVKDGSQWTPLMRAASFDILAVVEYLLQQGADVNAIDGFGDTALHHAREQIIPVLIHWGVDVNRTNRLGLTALHYACRAGEVDKVKRIMSTPTCDTSIRDRSGKTALDLARFKLEKGHEIRKEPFANIIKYMTDIVSTSTKQDPEHVTEIHRQQEASVEQNEDQSKEISVTILANAIRRQYVGMVRDLHCSEHVEYLSANNVLSKKEKDMIEAESGEVDKVRKFLGILFVRDTNSWAPVFLESLKMSADCQGMVKEIEKERRKGGDKPASSGTCALL